MTMFHMGMIAGGILGMLFGVAVMAIVQINYRGNADV